MPRASAPVAALVVLVTLAGCGGDTGSDAEDTDDKPITALTADQAAQAVLQPENMGEGWTSEPSTEDESTAPGCLADVEVLTDQLERQERSGTEFSFGDILTVESTVSTYADEESIKAVFDQVQTVSAACTNVTGPDEDGNEWNLTLATSEEAVYDDVDDQYSVSGSGTLTTPDGTDVQIFVETTAVRLGQNVASVSTFDFEQRTTEHAAWTEIAVQRFVDVAEGEEPDDDVAPAPGASA